MPRKPLRLLTSEDRAQRARERAQEGAVATAEYYAAAQAAIARIPELRRKRLAKLAREGRMGTLAQAPAKNAS
jgi:uncharacterized protein YbbK (DUF523 family)